jgi:tyrosyl-tRNA synthetase
MERLELIKRNTEEIVSEDELKTLLKTKKQPSAYIGMACTGKIHVGYFVPIMKIKDFLAAGFKFYILIADLHAHLDDRKAPFELLDKRVEYYQKTLTAMLKSVGADMKSLSFIRGKDFQLEKDYVTDMLRLSASNTLTRCKRAASEVVRFGDEPKLSGFIYPIMQALDEEYLKVDCQYGGIDQRKLLMFARENLPKLGYKARIEIMTPMLPGLKGEKMSASVKESKIDILASKEEIKTKVNKAFCPEGIVENNGVLAFFKQVIMTLKQNSKEKLIIKRPEKFGGNLEFGSYEELEKFFVEKKLHPMDLKTTLTEELDKLIDPIRKQLKVEEKLIKEAYS